jgi:anthranilate synthase component II
MKKVAVLDNYDSFTYNLVHLIRDVTGELPDVFRNDKITVSELERYDSLLLSPGPGLPSEAGIMPEAVKRLAPHKNILGVCLGHQCIAEVFGSTLVNMEQLCHGKGIVVDVKDREEKLFKNTPEAFLSGRYHSWTVDPESIPSCLTVTATDAAGRVMALRHNLYDVRGVQFHPESILTEFGKEMIAGWLSL